MANEFGNRPRRSPQQTAPPLGHALRPNLTRQNVHRHHTALAVVGLRIPSLFALGEGVDATLLTRPEHPDPGLLRRGRLTITVASIRANPAPVRVARNTFFPRRLAAPRAAKKTAFGLLQSPRLPGAGGSHRGPVVAAS
jgi:hypothetical protein